MLLQAILRGRHSIPPPVDDYFFGLTDGNEATRSLDGFTWSLAMSNTSDAINECARYDTNKIIFATDFHLFSYDLAGGGVDIYEAPDELIRFNLETVNDRVYFQENQPPIGTYVQKVLDTDGSITTVTFPLETALDRRAYGNGTYVVVDIFHRTYTSILGDSFLGPDTAFSSDPPAIGEPVFYLLTPNRFAILGANATVHSRTSSSAWSAVTVTPGIVSGIHGNASLLSSGSILTFACCKTGGVLEIYRSADGGQTWSLRETYSGSGSSDIYAFNGASKFIGGRFIYQFVVGGDLLFATSTDNGLTWSSVLVPAGGGGQLWGKPNLYCFSGYSTADFVTFIPHAIDFYPAAIPPVSTGEVLYIS